MCYYQFMKRANHTYSAGGLVLSPSQTVLMVQEFGEFWGLPRGHINEGETKLEAAKREIFEESGITDLTKIVDLGSYSRSTFDSDGIPNNAELKHITFFAFTTSQTELNIKDKDITDAGWFSTEEAGKLFINEQDLDFYNSSLKIINLKT